MNHKYVAYAIASLLTWGCTEENHLRELMAKWSYVDLLTEEEKELVVRLVADWPTVVTT